MEDGTGVLYSSEEESDGDGAVQDNSDSDGDGDSDGDLICNVLCVKGANVVSVCAIHAWVSAPNLLQKWDENVVLCAECQ